jgi:glycosyltransferase involved in cell wall biosynthesis
MAEAVRPLNILMVSARYFPTSGGGTEVHTREVSRRLTAAGHQVTVLTTRTDGRLPKIEDADGVRILRVGYWPRGSDLFFAPGVFWTIVRGSWDIVHCQGYHTLVAPLAMLGALRAKVPYVLTFHGGGHSSRLRNAVRGTQRALLQPLLVRAARLITLADFELTLFGDRLGIPRDHFVMIPNGADLPRLEQPVSAPSAAPVIASVGRLERYKGHHRLIAALPHILIERPDARVWIAGSGPYAAELRQLAQRLGVADRVEIRSIPSNDRQAMATELSKVALVVLLSEYETQPIAVLEALSLGRPALVADTSGLSELARKGYARAVPIDSTPQQVAAAVLRQLSQPLLPTSLELPTWEACAANLQALYAEVVRGAECAS